ncbi:hypothetical protein CRI77_16195 [Mycolicibacterium duvalii]|uniref:UDP-N-acetylglucosamine kinase n=1 Tax=Mycolicibacterium duvalii TaxID=39688 RepID=A0A7I7K5A9_9MYCO|nr:zeta toxin family protein [Mycolicibacterium duvalii]MCV7367729.1 zeta toxin family protein [Mycolicibacterium duvalii]PEG39440.1 hypothetical protein CRI77_16195 [Mycolicibacterium duvalii]BBX18681.1 hypothetical protein MDUV_35410 [Mycolicibacterium duvalii]
MAFQFTDPDYRAHTDRVEELLSQLRSAGTDSRSICGRVERGWTVWCTERRNLQRALVDDLWDEHARDVPRAGVAYVLGGLAGAGKTTLRANPDNNLTPERFLILDAEDIEVEMARRGMIPAVEGLSPMESSALVHEEAWELANRLAQRAYRENCNVLWEIPMNSQRATQHVTDLKGAGYAVYGGFADAPVDEARERTLQQHRRGEEDYRNRRGLGGRYIPASVHESCRPDAPAECWAPRPPAPGAHVRGLVRMYELGTLPFEHLVSAVRGRWHARRNVGPDAADWVEVYRRCEAVPEDDDLFWISVAEDAGTLSAEQSEKLFSALETMAGERV